ncbi:membrane protein [Paractinoplanes abujensis]|uniref:Peptidoglycan/LPS O-acetylase OafA/YrhL n=1 Tax=Paractinoplanes abujensis TaxID=882441 RepID=A0A7W7G271_9ACTN|nr:acyltransferase [Actinoplanes abujensis]MBB4693399.1 peptidoglycan/LPS O-acetylase OafA/YrhL [Actinoplanes abujensis]GID24603.1 membrane protein [Actinoplanes abujensis]
MTRATGSNDVVRQRDRFIDGLRALAILGVVSGHWLVGALVETRAGGLRIDSPMRYLEWLHPATWFLQMLGLFFLVGGYTAAQGLHRARARGETDIAWVRRRLWRIGRPVVAATMILAVALPLLGLLGLSAGTARTTVVLFVQPLWFMGVYAVTTSLTPYALRLDRRGGLWVIPAFAAAVAAVDLARFGLDGTPAAVGYLSVLPAWAFAYQLGVAWSSGRVDRRIAGGLLAGGLALFVVLLVVLKYPVSLVSVPGAMRSNSNPPSLMVPALAAIQAGGALLMRERIERLLRRPRVWAVVAALNLSAMSIFCWHQVALVGVSEVARRFGTLPGLGDAPGDGGWVAARLAWYPVLAVVLAGLVVLVRRYEHPVPRGPVQPAKTAASTEPVSH